MTRNILYNVLESISNGHRGHRGCSVGPDVDTVAVTATGIVADFGSATTVPATVFVDTTAVTGWRWRVGHFQVQLYLRSERLSPGDAVHRARLVLGQLPDDDFVRPEPQVPGRTERRPDAHVTLAAGRPTPGSLPLHSACYANNTIIVTRYRKPKSYL